MGPILFGTAGMTSEGVARKAAERSFFAKLLYLSDCDDLLDQNSVVREQLSIPDCFGMRNPDDVERLRIVSLHNVDLNTLDTLASEPSGEDEELGN